MKKIFSFMLLLCLAVGARAQVAIRSLTGIGSATTTPVSGKEYVFKCNGQESQITYMCAGGTNNNSFSATTDLPTGPDAMRYVWRLEQDGSTWKIINVVTGKQVKFESSSNNGSVTLTETGTAVTIDVSGEYVGLANANGQYIDMGHSGASPCTWSGGVNGSRRMTIHEANITEELVQAGKIYTITPMEATRGVLFVADGSDKFDVCGGTKNNAANKDISVDATNPNQQFVFVESGGKLYLYNVGQKKFATRAGGKVGASYIPSNYVTLVGSGLTNSFHIQFDGTEKLNISTGYNDGCAVLGWNVADDGNRLIFTEVGDSPIDNETFSEFITASMDLPSKMSRVVDAANIGQGVNTYTSSLGDYTTQYNNLRTQYEAIRCGETTVETLNTLKTTADLLISSTSLNMPEAGKFYRFKNGNKNLTSNLQESGDKQGRMKMEDASTAFNTRESVFFLTNDNKLIAYANGLYTKNFTSGNSNYGFENVGSTGNAVSFADGNVGSASPVYHISCGNRYLYGADGNSVLDASDNVDTRTGYDWTIEKVEYLPVVVSEDVDYGTLYTPVALSLRDGLTAYTGSINGDWLHLNPVTSVIPAGSAVVLKDDGTAQRDETTGHIYLQVSNSTAAAAEDNALRGQTTTIATVANAYTLQNNATYGLGFYPFSGTTLAGFKAYMLNGSGVRGFAFQEGETTSIEAAEGTQLNEPIYDLSGRRVQKATKGLFIVGGKKVFIK